MLVERAAELDAGPGLARLGGEPLVDVARVLADVCMNVDDHGNGEGDDEDHRDRDATGERRREATTTR